MPKSIERWCALWVGAMVACAGGETGVEVERASCAQRGAEMPVEPSTDVGQSSALMVAQRVESAHQVSLHLWRDVGGAAETLEATVSVSANPDRAWLVPYRDPEDTNCPPSLEVDAVVQLRTPDGSLDESIPGRISLRAGLLTFAGTLPLQQKRGTFEPAAASPQAAYSINMTRALETSEGALAWTGQLSIAEPNSNVDRLVAEW